MLNNLLLWNKIGRVVKIIAEQLNIPELKALDVFYLSQTCINLHNPDTELYLAGDLYIADNVIAELKHQQ